MFDSKRSGSQHQSALAKAGSLVLLLALTTACGNSQSTDGLLTQARQFQEKGDNASALIQLKNVLQQNPDDPEARYLLGLIYNDKGDFNGGEKELRRALELKVDPARVLPALGRSLLMEESFQKVLEEIKTPKDAKPEIAAAILSLRGRALTALGKPEEANAAFKQALALQSGLTEALLGQARLAFDAKDSKRALALTEQVIAAEPGNADAWLMKGDMQRQLADNDAAVAAYRKVVELYPDNLLGHVDLTLMQLSLGNYPEANKSLDVLNRLQPASPMVKYLQGLMEFRKGNYAAAVNPVQEALNVAADYQPALLLLGAVQNALGSYEQAKQYLQKVLDKDPKNLYARILLITALSKTNDNDSAIAVLQPTLQDNPDNSDLLALAGEVYLHNNDTAKATEYYKKASELDPKNAAKRTGLGLSHLAAGQTETAMAELGSAVALDANSFQADELLIMTHMGKSEFDDALVALKSMEKKQPNNPLTYNIKAAAYIGKKDYVQARANLEHALELQPNYFPAASNLAQLDLQDKKPEVARQRFLTLLEKDKSNIQALVALANIASQEGKSDEVLGYLEKAKAGNPGVLQPLLALAKYYLVSTGDMKKALAAAQDALIVSPNNPEVLDTLGLIQLGNNQKDQALSTYKDLVKADPKNPLAQLRMATAETNAGKPEAAIDSLKKALELNPNYFEAKVALSALQLRNGHEDEALELARTLEKDFPTGSAGYVLEGDVQYKRQKYAEAAAMYVKGYELKSDGVLATKIHASLSQTGKPEAAQVQIDDWLKQNPADLKVRQYLADAYMKTEKFPAAIDQYQLILQKQPQDLISLNNIAYAYGQVKDPRAMSYAEQAYKIKPDNAAVVDTLGWMVFENGKDNARGLELLQKAQSLDPAAMDIRYHLAQAWLKSGDKTRARTELEKIKASTAQFPERQQALDMLQQL